MVITRLDHGTKIFRIIESSTFLKRYQLLPNILVGLLILRSEEARHCSFTASLLGLKNILVYFNHCSCHSLLGKKKYYGLKTMLHSVIEIVVKVKPFGLTNNKSRSCFYYLVKHHRVLFDNFKFFINI
jgi:hypothetical protein